MITRRVFAQTALGVALVAPGFAGQALAASPGDISGKARVDATPRFLRDLARLRGRRDAVLRIPAGTHHFWPKDALHRMLAISNNDSGENHIAFPVLDADGLTIEGNGARLVFHGLTTPFAVIGSRDVRIRNLEIDWEVPFHCEADVLTASADETVITMRIPEPFSYRIDDQGRFHFAGEGFEVEGIGTLLEFDPVKRETGFQVRDNYFVSRDGRHTQPYRVETVSPRTLRMTVPAKFRDIPTAGSKIVILPPGRRAPAFFIDDSERVTLSGVTIRHAGCMGVIAQMSRDIAIDNCVVAPSEGSGRLISTVVDATHFVNCTGAVTLTRSRFASHMDDALNVHGIYLRIVRRTGTHTLVAERFDVQQRGVRMLQSGDEVTIADAANVDIYHRTRVTAVDYPDDRTVAVTLAEPPPQSMAEGDVIDNVSRQAAVVMRGCSVTKNRARGILISTGAVLIENNRFHSPGSAIRISGGVDHWYEAGPVSRVTIRRNLFDNCKYGSWGAAVIDATAIDAKTATSDKPYHGLIEITDNRFTSFDGFLVKAYRVGELRITGNILQKSTAYPAFRKVRAPFEVKKTPKVTIADNSILGFEFADQVTRL